MSKPSVYLAGPITGLKYDDAQEWRSAIAPQLAEAGIEAFSPLRLKDYLRDLGPLEKQYQNIHPLSNDKGIITRDFNDVKSRDAILVNFLECGDRVSIGTVWEIGVARALVKPIIVAMEEDNVHAHAMVNESAGFIVRTLEDAVDIVKAVLLP